MFRFQLAYKHLNSAIEGFTGTGFTGTSAHEDCINQIKLKCRFLDQPFNEENIIHTETGMDKDAMENVRQDWVSSARYVEITYNTIRLVREDNKEISGK